ncbi:sulfotransferase family protein [Gordonia otitidis]|uniref:sulfotransferase family protein n=1 Tax=Gordonia otitidis TaxID=249058 RepID=UPI001D144913|nr:sulfotransferase family protein [Gordonia otitidis]UEA58529.1 sulfotransferase family protein [Gordonia otitidis]
MSVVYVHVGLPKTGTTHLQDRLWWNRDLAFRHSGLLYPGNEMVDHFHAATHLQPDRYLDWVDPAFAHSWPTMVSQMRAWPGKSLVSHELFATTRDDQIESLVNDLSFADEVHVIVTVRDLARQLPSVWQENVKNQRLASFDDFVASVRRHAPRRTGSWGGDMEEEPFWEFQDYVGILGRWAEFVGPERAHLVTVASPGTAGSSLWERFLSVLDVDPAPMTIDVPTNNTSLSAAQAEFLRRLNSRLQPDDIEWERYERVVKGHIIAKVLFAQKGGTPLGLSTEQRGWVAEEAEAMVDAVRVAGYPVTGDLGDLVVARTSGDDSRPPTVDEILDASLDAVAGVAKTMPYPETGARMQTRAANVVRRVGRRVVSVRRRLG